MRVEAEDFDTSFRYALDFSSLYESPCWGDSDSSTDKIVKRIVYVPYQIEGGHGESDWHLVIYRDDGKWEYIKAGCSYTGWMSAKHGDSFIGETLYDIVYGHMTESSRNILGIPEIK